MIGSTVSVSFSAAGDVPAQGAEIVAVLADDADRSSVLRGENSGRTLLHVAVARSLTSVATLNSAREQTVQIPLPPSFQDTQGHHLILFARQKVMAACLAQTRSRCRLIKSGDK